MHKKYMIYAAIIILIIVVIGLFMSGSNSGADITAHGHAH